MSRHDSAPDCCSGAPETGLLVFQDAAEIAGWNAEDTGWYLKVHSGGTYTVSRIRFCPYCGAGLSSTCSACASLHKNYFDANGAYHLVGRSGTRVPCPAR